MSFATTLGSLYRPTGGILPASELASLTIVDDNAPTDYVDISGTRWDSDNLNKQTSNFVAIAPTHPEYGALNLVSGSTTTEIGDLEFNFDGDRFTLMLQTFGHFDLQIYVDDQPIQHDPIEGDHQGYTFVDVKFTATKVSRKIRVVLPIGYFLQVIHESLDAVTPTADRFSFAIVADSYGAQQYAGPGSHMIGGIPLWIAEATGFAVHRLAQGSTGYIADANSAGGNSEYGSTSRMAALDRVEPQAILFWGTINDGAHSPQDIADAADATWTAVAAQHPGVPIIVAGIQPYGRPAGAQATRNDALRAAAAAHPAVVKFIDWYGVTAADAWWSGTGSQNSPVGDGRQDVVLGPDTIHPSTRGARYIASRFVAELSEVELG